jgi:hypothetical protein
VKGRQLMSRFSFSILHFQISIRSYFLRSRPPTGYRLSRATRQLAVSLVSGAGRKSQRWKELRISCPGTQKRLLKKTGGARTLVFAGPGRLGYLPDASFGAAAAPGASVQDARHGIKRVAALCSRDAAKSGVFALFERAGMAPFGLSRRAGIWISRRPACGHRIQFCGWFVQGPPAGQLEGWVALKLLLGALSQEVIAGRTI